MKIKIKKDTAFNVYIMSAVAAPMVIFSLPLAVLMGLGFGLLLGTESNDEYELEITSFEQWSKLIKAAHLDEEATKTANVAYWRNRYQERLTL